MLIITRKIDQSIHLAGGPATVKILGVERDRVKVGIEADKSILILRSELLEREQESA